METNLLQSTSWMDFQKSLKKQTFHEKSDNFEYFAIKETTRLGSYLFVPYGPILLGSSPESSLKSALASLKSLARTEHALFVRIEPRFPVDKTLLKSFSLKKSHDIEPADTWILDLKGTEDELKSRLPSRLLRYHRALEKNGLEIVTSKNPEDVHFLLDLQKSLAEKKNLHTFSLDYYKKQLAAPFSTLYLVRSKKEENKGEVLAAGLVFDYQDTRYNLQGAQSDLGRSSHATGVLTIQLILDAKKDGKTIFDFWGIAPEGAPASHPWAGFTGFKKTFQGTELHFSGTYDLPVSKKYPLYLFLRRLNRTLRRH